MSCDWCDGAGCEECTGGGSSGNAVAQSPDDGVCSACQGAGCDYCIEKVLDFGTKIENAIYEGDDSYRANKELSLDSFKKVVALIDGYSPEKDGSFDEDSKSKALFKALNYVAILSVELKKPESEINQDIEKFLSLIFQSTRHSGNETFESVEKLLRAAQNAGGSVQTKVYDTICNLLGKVDPSRPAGVQNLMTRLLFKVHGNLANSRLAAVTADISARRDPSANKELAEGVLETMHGLRRLPNGADDILNHKTELLDIYAKKTELFLALQDYRDGSSAAQSSEVKDAGPSEVNFDVDVSAERSFFAQMWEKTQKLADSVAEAKSLSVIKECWGKMWAYENKWDLAKIEFMDAFSSAVSVEKRAYELY